MSEETKASEVVSQEDGQVSQEEAEIRNAAKEAGISNWYNKGLDRLKEELGEKAKSQDGEAPAMGITDAVNSMVPPAKSGVAGLIGSARDIASGMLSRLQKPKTNGQTISQEEYEALAMKRLEEIQPYLASRSVHQRFTAEKIRQWKFEVAAISNGTWHPNLRAPKTASQKDTDSIIGGK